MFDLGVVQLGVRLNTAGIQQDLEQIRKQGERLSSELSKSVSTGALNSAFKNNIVPKVDLRQLKALNAELDLKVKHYKSVQQQFNQQPLTPKVNQNELNQLTGALKQIEQLANNPVQISLNQSIHQTTTSTVHLDTQAVSKEASQAINSAFKKINLPTNRSLLGTLLTPLRLSITGFYEGVGMAYAQRLTGGMIKSIEKSLDTSLHRIGLKAGDRLTQAIGVSGLKAKLQPLSVSMGEVINTKEFQARSKAVQTAIDGIIDKLLDLKGLGKEDFAAILNALGGMTKAPVEGAAARRQSKVPQAAQAARAAQPQAVEGIPRDAKGVTFAVGGFTEKGGELEAATALKGELDPLLKPRGQAVIPFAADFVGLSHRIGQNKIKSLTAMMQRTLGTALDQYNASAVKLVAQILAVREQHPDLPINIAGLSAGGLVTRDALALLNQLGIKDVKGLTIGTPEMGMSPPQPNELRIAGDKDYVPFLPKQSGAGRHLISGLKGHGLLNYTQHPEFQEIAREYLAPESASRAQPASTPTGQPQFVPRYGDIMGDVEGLYQEIVGIFDEPEVAQELIDSGFMKELLAGVKAQRQQIMQLLAQAPGPVIEELKHYERLMADAEAAIGTLLQPLDAVSPIEKEVKHVQSEARQGQEREHKQTQAKAAALSPESKANLEALHQTVVEIADNPDVAKVLIDNGFMNELLAGIEDERRQLTTLMGQAQGEVVEELKHYDRLMADAEATIHSALPPQKSTVEREQLQTRMASFRKGLGPGQKGKVFEQQSDFVELYQQSIAQMAQASGISPDQVKVPKLEFKELAEKIAGFYDRTTNSIVVNQRLLNELIGKDLSPENLEKKLGTVVHELRHAAQMGFGETDVLKGARPRVELLKATKEDETQYKRLYGYELRGGVAASTRNLLARHKDKTEEELAKLKQTSDAIEEDARVFALRYTTKMLRSLGVLADIPKQVAKQAPNPETDALIAQMKTVGVRQLRPLASQMGIPVRNPGGQVRSQQELIDALSQFDPAELKRALPSLNQPTAGMQQYAQKMAGATREQVDAAVAKKDEFINQTAAWAKSLQGTKPQKVERLARAIDNVNAEYQKVQLVLAESLDKDVRDQFKGLQLRLGKLRAALLREYRPLVTPEQVKTQEPGGVSAKVQEIGPDVVLDVAAQRRGLLQRLSQFGPVQGIKNAASEYRDFSKSVDKSIAGLLSLKQTAISAIPGMSMLSGIVGKVGLGLVALVAGGMAISFLTQLGGAALKTAMEFQRLEQSITFAAGGEGPGRKTLSFIKQDTDRVSGDYRTALENYKQLSAATQGTPLEGEETQKLFSAVQQAAAVRGLSPEQTSQAIVAISQMASKETISMEELRGQLSEALPGSMNTFSRALGASTAEMQKMVTSGEVLATDALPKFRKQLGAETAEGVAGAANTAQAALNRYNNAQVQLLDSLGRAIQPVQIGVLNTLAAGLGLLTSLAVPLATVIGVRLVGALVGLVGAARLAAVTLTVLRLGLQGLLRIAPAFLAFGAQVMVVAVAFKAFDEIIRPLFQESPIKKFADESVRGLERVDAALKNVSKSASALESTLPRTQAEANQAIAKRRQEKESSGPLGFLAKVKTPFSDVGPAIEARNARLEVERFGREAERLRQSSQGYEGRFKKLQVLPPSEQKLAGQVLRDELRGDSDRIKQSQAALRELAKTGNIDAPKFTKFKNELAEALRNVEQTQKKVNDLLGTQVSYAQQLKNTLLETKNALSKTKEDSETGFKRAQIEAIQSGVAAGQSSEVAARSIGVANVANLQTLINAYQPQIDAYRQRVASPQFKQLEKDTKLEKSGELSLESLDEQISKTQDERAKSILETRKQLKTMEKEVQDNTLALAQQQQQASEEQYQLGKRLVDFYSEMARTARDATLDIREIKNQTAITNMKARISKALIGNTDDFLETFSQSFEEYMNLTFEREQITVENLRNKNSIDDQITGLKQSLADVIRTVGDTMTAIKNQLQQLQQQIAGMNVGGGGIEGPGIDQSPFKVTTPEGGDVKSYGQLTAHHGGKGYQSTQYGKVHDFTLSQGGSTSVAVPAPASGVVEMADWISGGGNTVRVRMDDGRAYVIMHLERFDLALKKGGRVMRGQRLGTQGRTGQATGVHVHLEAPEDVGTSYVTSLVSGKFGGGTAGGGSALMQAIIGQESGGNASAVNPTTGALGLGQLMPFNVGPWSQEILGKTLTPQQFLQSPELQKTIISGKLNKMYQKNLTNAYGDPDKAVRMTAAEWYSGSPFRYDSTKPQGGYPSIRAYTQQVLSRFKGSGGFSVSAAAPTGGSFGGGGSVEAPPPETNFDKYMRLGYAAHKKGDLNTAKINFQKAVNEAGNTGIADTALENTDMALAAKKRKKETPYEKSLRIGLAASEKGDWNTAAINFQKAVKIKPTLEAQKARNEARAAIKDIKSGIAPSAVKAASFGDIESILTSGVTPSGVAGEAIAVLGDKRGAIDEKTKAELGLNDVQLKQSRAKLFNMMADEHDKMQKEREDLADELEQYRFDALPFESRFVGIYQAGKEEAKKIKQSGRDKTKEIRAKRQRAQGLRDEAAIAEERGDPGLAARMRQLAKESDAAADSLEKANKSIKELQTTLQLAKVKREVTKLGEDLGKENKDAQRSVRQLIDQYTPDNPYKQYRQQMEGLNEGFEDKLQEMDKQYFNSLQDKEVATTAYNKALKEGNTELAAQYKRAADGFEDQARQLEGLIKKLKEARGAVKEFVREEFDRALLEGFKSSVGAVGQLQQFAGGDPQLETSLKLLDIATTKIDADQSFKQLRLSYTGKLDALAEEGKDTARAYDDLQTKLKKQRNRKEDTKITEEQIKQNRQHMDRINSQVIKTQVQVERIDEITAQLPDILNRALQRTLYDEQLAKEQKQLDAYNAIQKGWADAFERRAARKKQQGDIFGASQLEQQAAGIRAQEELNTTLRQIAQDTISDINLGGKWTPEQADILSKQAVQKFQDDMQVAKDSAVNVGNTVRDTFKESFISSFSEIITQAKSFGDAIEGIFKNLSNKLIDLAANKVFEQIFGNVLFPKAKPTPVNNPLGSSLIDPASTLLAMFGSPQPAAPAPIGNVSGILGPVAPLLSLFGGGFGFQAGGMVPGHSNKDDTLIMAMGGEGILSHKGMKALGGAKNLHRLNRGRMPQFAMGGIVGQNNVQPFHMPSLPSARTPMLGTPRADTGERKITHEYNVTQIDERRYVDEETFKQGMARSAQEGSRMALSKIQYSTNTRTSLGLR